MGINRGGVYCFDRSAAIENITIRGEIFYCTMGSLGYDSVFGIRGIACHSVDAQFSVAEVEHAKQGVEEKVKTAENRI